MELFLARIHGTRDYTLGKLYKDSPEGDFICYTLEDEERPIKIPKVTAIPLGRYQIIFTASPKFKRMMPLLLGVPKFDAIRIHWGEKAEHSDGCILTGLDVDKMIPGRILRGRVAFAMVEKILLDAIVTEKQRAFITIL